MPKPAVSVSMLFPLLCKLLLFALLHRWLLCKLCIDHLWLLHKLLLAVLVTWLRQRLNVEDIAIVADTTDAHNNEQGYPTHVGDGLAHGSSRANAHTGNVC